LYVLTTARKMDCDTSQCNSKLSRISGAATRYGSWRKWVRRWGLLGLLTRNLATHGVT
jgi:hypothetical protein